MNLESRIVSNIKSKGAAVLENGNYLVDISIRNNLMGLN